MTTEDMITTPPGLYLCLEAATPEIALTSLEQARTAAPVEVVLLQNPELVTKDLITSIQAHNIAVLIKEDADLAIELSADGVHLSEPDSETFAAAQQKLDGKDMIIGAEVSASRHLSMLLAEQGVSYIALKAPGLDEQTSLDEEADADEQPDEEDEISFNQPPTIAWWTGLIETPCVAWNLETEAELKDAIEARADFVALSPALWHKGDATAETLTKLMKLIQPTDQTSE